MDDRVLSIIKSIQIHTSAKPCKKAVQKLTFLIQELSEDFGFERFDFSIHFYGPYSAELDLDIRYFHSCDSINISFERNGHLLSVNDDMVDEINELNENAETVIKKFASKKASELELIATTLYVQREIESDAKDDIINGVLRIKGDKYTYNDIQKAMDELNMNGSSELNSRGCDPIGYSRE